MELDSSSSNEVSYPCTRTRRLVECLPIRTTLLGGQSYLRLPYAKMPSTQAKAESNTDHRPTVVPFEVAQRYPLRASYGSISGTTQIQVALAVGRRSFQ